MPTKVAGQAFLVQRVRDRPLIIRQDNHQARQAEKQPLPGSHAAGRHCHVRPHHEFGHVVHAAEEADSSLAAARAGFQLRHVRIPIPHDDHGFKICGLLLQCLNHFEGDVVRIRPAQRHQ